MYLRKFYPICLVAVLVVFASLTQNVGASRAQDKTINPSTPLGTAFTYQGVLTDAGDTPVNGNCDFTFHLYDAESGGNQVGTDLEIPAVSVSEGLFKVTLDFGSAAFTGEARWLEVSVRCPAGGGTYSTLDPRQALTPAPYASFAPASGNAGLLDGLEASAFASSVHLHAGEDIASGTVAETHIDSILARDSEIWPTVLASDGAGSTLDADLLDGLQATAFASSVHHHAGEDITTGTVAELRIDFSLARDSEIWPTVLASDGAGSTLDADLLDGLQATAFASSVHHHAGEDITTGTVAELRIDSILARDSEIWPTVLASDGAGSTLDADLLDGQQASYFRNATNINAGTLGTGYYSAYSDLSAEGYLDLNAGGDLVTRDQGDARYSMVAHNHWGQSWTGTGTGLSVSGGTTGLSGSGSSYGVYGSSTSDAGYAYGVYGSSTSNTGNAFGVYGIGTSSSTYAYGLYGISDSTLGRGVMGATTAASGITMGVRGYCTSSDGFGVAGINTTSGVGVGAWSASGNLIEAYYGSAPGGTLEFYITTNGSVYANTGFYTFKLSDYDGLNHALPSLSSTETWLEDFGFANLVEGKTTVNISPDFAGVTNLSAKYHVFITPQGDSLGLYVTNLTPTSFEVLEQNGGRSNIAFSYRIVAKQAGFESLRLPEVILPAPVDVTGLEEEGPQP